MTQKILNLNTKTPLQQLNLGGKKVPMEQDEKGKNNVFVITPKMEQGHPVKTLWLIYVIAKKHETIVVRYEDKSDNKKIAAWLVTELPVFGLYPQNAPVKKSIETLDGRMIEVFEIVFRKARFVLT